MNGESYAGRVCYVIESKITNSVEEPTSPMQLMKYAYFP